MSLTLLKEIGTKQYAGRGYSFGLFKCECGSEIESPLTRVKSGLKQYCRKGCPSSKTVKHGLVKHRLNSIWRNMKTRCYNPNGNENYKDNSIEICDEWVDDFKAFYDWSIVNGYSDNLSIDRRDNLGNYEPGNCRFVDNTIQTQNSAVLRKYSTTGYKGVSLQSNGRYQSHITHEKQTYHLGTFETPEEAYVARVNFIRDNGTNHTY